MLADAEALFDAHQDSVHQLCAPAYAPAQSLVWFDGPLTVVATRNSQRFYEARGFVAVEENSFVRGESKLHFAVVKVQRPSLRP